jgi:hypothetical protein
VVSGRSSGDAYAARRGRTWKRQIESVSRVESLTPKSRSPVKTVGRMRGISDVVEDRKDKRGGAPIKMRRPSTRFLNGMPTHSPSMYAAAVPALTVPVATLRR